MNCGDYESPTLDFSPMYSLWLISCMPMNSTATFNTIALKFISRQVYPVSWKKIKKKKKKINLFFQLPIGHFHVDISQVPNTQHYLNPLSSLPILAVPHLFQVLINDPCPPKLTQCPHHGITTHHIQRSFRTSSFSVYYCSMDLLQPSKSHSFSYRPFYFDLVLVLRLLSWIEQRCFN